MENPPWLNQRGGFSPPTRGIITHDIDFVNTDIEIIYTALPGGEEELGIIAPSAQSSPETGIGRRGGSCSVVPGGEMVGSAPSGCAPIIRLMNVEIMSRGGGKTTVLFFSVGISVSVCK